MSQLIRREATRVILNLIHSTTHQDLPKEGQRSQRFREVVESVISEGERKQIPPPVLRLPQVSSSA